MPRYVAFLRGVMPMNARMPDLKRAFELAGFTDVKTVLSSGNVVFSSRVASEATLQRRAEQGMMAHLGRSFDTIVRSAADLRQLLDDDPFSAHPLPKNAKRVVTFLKEPPARTVRLPGEVDGAQILELRGREVLTAYAPHPSGPVFMTLIEKTFGKQVTTRTWDTVRKCVAAAEG